MTLSFTASYQLSGASKRHANHRALITTIAMRGVVFDPLDLRRGFQGSNPLFRPLGGEDCGDLAVGHGGQTSQNIPEVLVGFDSASATAFDDGVEDRSSMAGLTVPVNTTAWFCESVSPQSARVVPPCGIRDATVPAMSATMAN